MQGGEWRHGAWDFYIKAQAGPHSNWVKAFGECLCAKGGRGIIREHVLQHSLLHDWRTIWSSWTPHDLHW